MESKLAMRRRMRAVRDALPAEARQAASDAIRQRVLALPRVAGARVVFCYVSFRSEVQTPRLIEGLLAAGKAVCVPRMTEPGRMLAAPIEGLDELEPGPYGIPQPRPIDDEPGRIDVTLVPGLAFTAAGDRLGYGAGHYDRWLAAHPTFAIGLCFDAQLVGELPTDPHDRRMDLVVSA